MSRGFVKEEDQEELPVIPPRAALPPGETNYVTPKGYQALLDEKEALESDRRLVPTDNETEHRHAVTVIDGKLALLNERITSARVLRPGEVPQDEVRFGAMVEFLNGTEKQRFQIVGVDEADVKQQKIAFTAPIARALMGKKRGDVVTFRMRGKAQKMKVLDIQY